MMQEILTQITWIEGLGVLFSVIQVLLARKNNVNNYLFGITGILLSLYIMFDARLYAEFTLNLYYLAMSIYGWIYWKFGKQQAETPISYTDTTEKIKAAAIVISTFLLFYFFLTHFTNSDVPVWDSCVSAFAWSGMWLMAKRKIENWIILNISNIISIPLMIHKGLYLYAVLTAFLFIVAVSAYFNWRNIIKREHHA